MDGLAMKHQAANHAVTDQAARKRKLRGAGSLAVALAAIALSGCNDHAAAPITRAAIVRTEIVQPRDRQASATLTGEIQARFRADVSFRVSGRVLARYVDVGARVEAGEVLALLDPAEQRADVDAATAAVLAAESQLRVAKVTFERQKTLIASGFTTRTVYDQAQEGLRTAESALEAAKAELGTSKDTLGYTALRAKAAGVITSRNLEVGQVVQAAQPVFSLAQDGERDAVFDIYESLLFGDLDDSRVSLALVSDTGATASGHVREVSPAIDAKRATIRVKVAIDDPSAAMTLGSAVAGTVKAKVQQQIALPWSALAAAGSKPAVWTVDPATKTAALKPVTIGGYEAREVLIKAGLEPGERVVIDGGKLLSVGQAVTYEGDPVMKRRAMVATGTFVSALVQAGCQQEAKAPEPVRPVLSIVLEPSSTDGLAAVGVVEPQYKTSLAFRVLGRLTGRPVSIGDLVSEGQTVGVIDPTALELAVRSARAELTKAEAQLATATATEQRQRTLITTDATTKQIVDNAEQARAGAAAAVAHAQANLIKATEQRSYAQIKAGFAGVVTAVGAEVGQVVSPGQNVVTVARPDIREAVVDIGEDFPVPLEIGLPFTVGLQLLPAVEVEGKVREIAPQADPATRLRRVRIALNSPPESFRLGTTVTAKLGKEQSPTLRVPASAVLAKDGANFVWVVDQPANTVSLHKVDLAGDPAGARVAGGLAPGVRIVTAGIHSLKQAQQVRIEQDQKP
jgi:membrane fusion protein, multidrug efflux system